MKIILPIIFALSLWSLDYTHKELLWCEDCLFWGLFDRWVLPISTTALGAWVVYIASRIGQRAAEKEKHDKFDKGTEAYNKKNYSEAIQIWRPLAEKGYAPAQFKLGEMYEDGIGFVKDYKKAFEWYEKGVNQNYAPSQAQLGYLYRKGLGLEKKYEEKALELYKKSAEQGDANGQNNLGFMYRKEKGGVPQSDEIAFYWYSKAADQGHAEAQYNIGYMYSNGLSVDPNPEEAVKWYRQSARQGDETAQYSLGRMHQQGKGLASVNNIHAYKWFYIADKNGDEEAKKRLDEVVKVMKKKDKTKGKAKTKEDIAEAERLAEWCIENLKVIKESEKESYYEGE